MTMICSKKVAARCVTYQDFVTKERNDCNILNNSDR